MDLTSDTPDAPDRWLIPPGIRLHLLCTKAICGSRRQWRLTPHFSPTVAPHTRLPPAFGRPRRQCRCEPQGRMKYLHLSLGHLLLGENLLLSLGQEQSASSAERIKSRHAALLFPTTLRAPVGHRLVRSTLRVAPPDISCPIRGAVLREIRARVCPTAHAAHLLRCVLPSLSCSSEERGMGRRAYRHAATATAPCRSYSVSVSSV